ncbi:MAG: ABC transporter permease subunit [Pseudomonadota bacterium]
MTDQAPTSSGPAPTLSLLTSDQSARLARIRRAKDLLARGIIMLGGFGVIAAILLIFFYLLWEVMPLFQSSSMEEQGRYSLPLATEADDGRTLALVLEEQNEVGARLTAAGELVFFEVASGRTVGSARLTHAATPTALAVPAPGGETFALGFADGRVLLAHQTFRVTYPDNVKTVDAAVEYPYGEEAAVMFAPDATGARGVAQLAVRTGDDGYTLAARAADGAAVLHTVDIAENMMTGEVEQTVSRREFRIDGDIQGLYFNNDGWFLFAVLADGNVRAYDLRGEDAPTWQQVALPTDEGVPAKATASAMLLGNISLLVGDDRGRIHQLFMVRDAQNNYVLTPVRSLRLSSAPISTIVPEQRRKSFAAIDAAGTIGFISTSAERLALEQTVAGGAAGIAVSPRGDRLLVVENGRVRVHAVHNEHPDVSWSALWGKVWYEGYDEPKYIWQSSASNNDFEPKFSLTPLAFGTLKAAIFAMILAMPLAICGAIFTAYFMAPRLRTLVKPTIEMMAALPTVILGFLAGLWLAPLFESALPAVFTMLIVTPLFIVAAAMLWSLAPERLRLAVAPGWEPLLLAPVIALAVALPFMSSGWMEATFFGGDVRVWLTSTLDIPFDQRNALVVGFAMGFAVIPTIYSIAEDALFEVPKHLTQGSLALGATPWQTMMRVVLPTASPGIFSAVMIGFGRAVGETMIVLMATGNTPVMTMNIFEGFRTLSANIAVEMPESEVGSTHFRILFLAALVLFLFTFLVNTTAEIIRHRLRKQYGTL